MKTTINIYWHVSCFTKTHSNASILRTNFNGFSARGTLVSQHCFMLHVHSRLCRRRFTPWQDLASHFKRTETRATTQTFVAIFWINTQITDHLIVECVRCDWKKWGKHLMKLERNSENGLNEATKIQLHVACNAIHRSTRSHCQCTPNAYINGECDIWSFVNFSTPFTAHCKRCIPKSVPVNNSFTMWKMAMNRWHTLNRDTLDLWMHYKQIAEKHFES